MKSFQTILLVVFGAILVFAVMVFAGIIPLGSERVVETTDKPVVAWGTIPSGVFSRIMQGIKDDLDKKYDIKYAEKPSESFEDDLINALAAGEGPDIIFIHDDLLLKQEDKLTIIPYASVPKRMIKDTFLDSVSVYMRPEGLIGVPLVIDPVVMYWNRDLFTNAGLVEPPKYWVNINDELSKILNIKDERNNILQSAIALGSPRNITHFKDIVLAQILQTGETIIDLDLETEGSFPDVTLGDTNGASSVVRYIADFSNPNLSKYSWNSAKGQSIDEFIAGKLAIYLGKGSDLDRISERNPHLNFDIAILPQLERGVVRTTFGRSFGIGTTKSSRNQTVALNVALALAFGQEAEYFSEALKLPPMRRDLVSGVEDDAHKDILNKSAIISKSFLDPNPKKTDSVFITMIEDVIVGRSLPGSAITNAKEQLLELILDIR